MKPPTDKFDAIAVYVPAEHLNEYWRMVARFRQLGPEDEILQFFLAMGVLTFILRDLPAALIDERKARQEQFDAFRAEMVRILEETTRQAVGVNNKSDILGKTLEHNATLFCQGANQIEKASQEAVKQIDVDGIAARLTARIEERVLVSFDAIATRVEAKLGLLEKLGQNADRAITTLRRVHFWPTIGGISFGILCLSLCLVVYGLKQIQEADKAALDEKLAQIQLMADSNKEAFAELARDQIKVDVVGVANNGQKQYGQKALRLTPALDVGAETPDNQSKRGIIYFAVPMTWSDTVEQTLGH
jgi:hypothetical protein